MLLGGEGGAAAPGGCGVRMLDRKATARDRLDEVDFGALQVLDANRVNEELDAVRFEHLIARALPTFLDHQPILEARTAPALNEDAQAASGLVLFNQQLADF